VRIEQVVGPHGDLLPPSALPAFLPRPKQRHVVRYGYDGANRLADIYLPREVSAGGDAVVHNRFGAGGRIESQRWGGRSATGETAGGVYGFTYTGKSVHTITDRDG